MHIHDYGGDNLSIAFHPPIWVIFFRFRPDFRIHMSADDGNGDRCALFNGYALDCHVVWSHTIHPVNVHCHIDDLVHDCSVSIANAMEILQSCIKPSTLSLKNGKSIFVQNIRMLIQVELRCVSRGQIENISPLIQVMAWRREDDKSLPEQTLTHFTDTYCICTSWPHWVITVQHQYICYYG